jgi:urease accessory protein
MMVDTSAQPAQSAQLGQLLMLASSNLPIGSYTYSQGVESAIESGVVSDEASTLTFMQDYLALAVIGYELPVLGLIMCALSQGHEALAANLAHDYHAGLESKEFVLESQQLAQAMVSWLNEVLSLGIPAEIPEDGFLPLFAHVAAVKTVPLGQMAGQRILWQLQSDLGAQVDALSANVQQAFDALITSINTMDTLDTSEEPDCQQLCQDLYESLNISNNLPNLAILSSMHEEQYSRLFRS